MQQHPQYQPPTPPRTYKPSLWDKTWKDKNGNIVLWQRPNIWLIVWAVLTTVSLFFFGIAANVLAIISHASLLVWSMLEIFRGINYFRRFLGVLVLLYVIAVLLK